MIKKESIRIFSSASATFLFATFLFAFILLLKNLALAFSENSTSGLLILLMVSLTLIAASALCLSFRKAAVCVDNQKITYSSGFLKKGIPYQTICSATLVSEHALPPISYKIWAYSLMKEKNGLFRLKNGKKAYIAGTSDSYLYLETSDFDAIFAVGEKGLSQGIIDMICNLSGISPNFHSPEKAI